jgi:hypothetical protein
MYLNPGSRRLSEPAIEREQERYMGIGQYLRYMPVPHNTIHAARDCCHQDVPPTIISQDLKLKQRREAAEHHPGACGVHNATCIVDVDILGAAERLGIQPEDLPASKIRNQACYEVSQLMGARGRGVQIKRANCFANACRALFHGNEPLPATMLEALCS